MPRVNIPVGQVLTITANAGASGFVQRITPSVTDAVAIAASSTTTVGPFVDDRVYEVGSYAGPLTWTVTPAVSSGNAGVQVLAFPIQLAAMTTSAADLLTNYTPGFRFKVLSVAFVVTTLGTGSGASQVLNLEIGTTDLTGGVLTILLADATPLGKVTAATAITGGNIGSATDTLSIEVAASGTVFTAGAGSILIRLQNLDV